MGTSFNKFKIIDKETTIVYTEDVNGNINGKFYIDTEDLSKVLMVKCRIYNGRVIYDHPAEDGKCRGQRQLSRYIMGIAEDYDVNDRKNSVVVDHIDHNPFNNKKHNLRIITCKENSRNRTGVDDCKFYKGVVFRNNYYSATICYKNNPVYLGQYKNSKKRYLLDFLQKLCFLAK